MADVQALNKTRLPVVYHIARIGGITGLLCLIILYPFLPGEYDRVAVGLSTMVQVFAVVGLLFVPTGVLWLVHEIQKQSRRMRNPPVRDRGYSFGLVSVVISLVVAAAVTLVAITGIGLLIGLLTIAIEVFIVARFVARRKVLKKARGEGFNPIPLYLVFIPLVVTLFQLVAAAPATDFSRTYAITHSTELIHDIEVFHATHGRYPNALQAVWKDYSPSVIGIEKYHFAPHGEAYNLYFEQPRFLFDNLGTLEFVVYNLLDEQTMISHTAWILTLPPEELGSNQGWYAFQYAHEPHWKSFFFD